MTATSAAEKRLAARNGRAGIVGVNIGANKDSADRIGDYERGVRRFATSRQLPDRQHLLAQHAGPAQHAGARAAGRTSCRASWRRATSSASARPPIFLKIAPDLGEAELADIAAEVTGKQGRRRHRLQHDDLPRPALRSSGTSRRDRRALGEAAVRALDRRAGDDAQAAWPRPSPSSASAASIRPKRRWKRSGPAPISSSSTPA